VAAMERCFNGGLGEAFAHTEGPTRIVRYETALDRTFKSSLHELKALQEARFELGSFAPSEVVSLEPPPAAAAERTVAPAAEAPQPIEQTAASGKLASLRHHQPEAVQAQVIVAAVRETVPRDRRERPETMLPTTKQDSGDCSSIHARKPGQTPLGA
ncbi:MAG: hypothetical protein HYS04_14710, partial [Acidobacteria bacterium]|nr:hypothetical protein [Acidobacteriota bacterium]